MKLRALAIAALILGLSMAAGDALVMWPVWAVEYDLSPAIRRAR